MPLVRRPSAIVELTQRQHIELRIGPGGRPSAFASDDERRRAWLAHRDRLLKPAPNRVGKRCWGWWRYESPVERDPIRETQQLLSLGVIAPDELRQIHAQWRRRVFGIRNLSDCFTEPRRARTYWLERRRSGIPDSFEPPEPDDYEFHADDD
jgi:hypothetical protein